MSTLDNMKMLIAIKYVKYFEITILAEKHWHLEGILEDMDDDYALQLEFSGT